MSDNIQETHPVQNVADIHKDLKEKAIFLAEYAAILEAVGVQTSRIQYNTIRIAKSFGYWCNILMFPQTISITLHNENREHSYIYVKNAGHGVELQNKYETIASLVAGVRRKTPFIDVME